MATKALSTSSSKPPSSSSGEIDDVCILRCREVFVYSIPTRRDAARGHRADQWGLDKPAWIGECQLRALHDTLVFRLVKDGKPFVESLPLPLVDINRPPPNGKPLTQFVEPTVDSGRYFVIRFKDPNGRALPMGMGFRERSDAFDFNAAINDRITQVQRHLQIDNAIAKSESDAKAATDDNDSLVSSTPSVDWSLKGPIRINLPKKKVNDEADGDDNAQLEGRPTRVVPSKRSEGSSLLIAPPPGGAPLLPAPHASDASAAPRATPLLPPPQPTVRSEGIPVTLSPALPPTQPSSSSITSSMASLTLAASSGAPATSVSSAAAADDDDEWGSFASATANT